MCAYSRMLLLAALLVVPTDPVVAQTSLDPSGHWEGTVQTPNMEIGIEVDLTKNSKGELSGTFGQPAQSVKGLPLSSVALDGRQIRFVLKADAEPTTFEGTISEDGKSISGDLAKVEYTLSFRLTRSGEARVAPAPKSAAIGKELEGTWNGTLAVGERQMRVTLKMTNQPDGSATGTVVSVDGSGVEIPIGMTQKASTLTIDVPSVGASYVGELNAEGTELAGTWTQQGSRLPLTFRRAAR
jgi:hypothetical protein